MGLVTILIGQVVVAMSGISTNSAGAVGLCIGLACAVVTTHRTQRALKDD